MSEQAVLVLWVISWVLMTAAFVNRGRVINNLRDELEHEQARHELFLKEIERKMASVCVNGDTCVLKAQIKENPIVLPWNEA